VLSAAVRNPLQLSRRLDLILEETNVSLDNDPYQEAVGIAQDLEEARRAVTELEQKLLYAMDRMCGGLALGVRRQLPGLNVGIDKGGCRVGYRSKSLLFRPDIKGKLWRIESPDPSFVRRFSKQYAPRTQLNADVAGMAQAVADFFRTHYKSLGEDIVGTGVLLIDGKDTTLGQLVEWVAKSESMLLS
jgi:hypothetical protein